MTGAGYFVIGILLGVIGGLILGVVRERKDMNKKYIFWGPDIKKEGK